MAVRNDKAGVSSSKALTDRDALIQIGNLIGGPTMSYAPQYELKELKERVQKVAKIVMEQLGVQEVLADPEKFRRNPGINTMIRRVR